MFQKGAYLLRNCIEAEYHYRLLQEEYDQDRERIFAGHYPGYETKYGMIEQETISTENAVIHIIESEERIKEEMEPLQKKRKVLGQALKILTEIETEVFNHIVWGDLLNNPPGSEELSNMSEKINKKLCNYLSTLSNA